TPAPAWSLGAITRPGGDGMSRPIGQGYASGLRGIAQDFGVNV
ncbi:chemical-damaging agent resistance protein C, partial [Streptomyces collinus]